MRDIVRLKTERELVRVKIQDGNAFWNEIGVNAGVSNLMLLSLNLLLPVLVNAAKLKFTAASINLKGEVEEDLMFDTGVLNGNEVKTKARKKWLSLKIPLKKKDQIAIDEEVARNLEAQLQAKLEEEESFKTKGKKEAT
ncbi:hypothetical protein Tco_1343656 [Tanacetum coccineum]